MNGFIRGALGLALAATAGLALAQPYGPQLAGGPPERGYQLAQAGSFQDDMPGPEAHAGPRPRHDEAMPPQGRYDAYGYDRLGLTADGYDRYGYDAHGFDRYGFNPDGYSRDGYDRYGYDERGLDRYGRRAPAARRAEADQDTRAYSAPRDIEPRDIAPRDYGYRDQGPRDPGYDGRYGPPTGYDPAALPPGYRAEGYSEGYGYSYDTRAGRGYDDRGYDDDRAYGPDRYAPARDDRRAYDPEVPSYGGAMQHFADPRCSTCGPVRGDCGCRSMSAYGGGGYETSSVSISPAFFYDNGGVGPIPDGGGYYGGGGGYAMAGSGASASSSAYASSSSRVSVSVRSGGGGHGGHGGGKGGCNCGGGHK